MTRSVMESSSLPEEADGASSSDVAHFASLTSCPVQQAAFFLEATNGKFDEAVEMYYGEPLSLWMVHAVKANSPSMTMPQKTVSRDDAMGLLTLCSP